MESISVVQCNENGHGHIRLYIFYKGMFENCNGDKLIRFRPDLCYYVRRFRRIKGRFE